ncbi:hypothetical protein MD484_g1763, partial [Candolleomyces efflorescens]
MDNTEKGQHFRQRYWLRSYLGYPPVRDAQPNTTHFALASLLHSGNISRIITQNVDGLHHKALTQGAGQYWSPHRLQEHILELHGTLHHKPEVVFFGESIKQEVKQRSYEDIESSDQLLVVGTTLATYSAFRLVKHALELKKPVILLNLGPTRADLLPNIEKINMASGAILVDAASLVMWVSS